MEISCLLGIGRFIIDLFSFPAADDQPSRFQLLEVMRNRRATHVHHSRKIDDAFFTMTQQPKNTDTASISKLFENISHSLKVFYAGRVLQHLFKAVYGLPIATYMKEYRVHQAMKLLRETDATIADIAAQLGYKTQGKFSKAFKDVVQVLPSEYRKDYQNPSCFSRTWP